MRTRTVGLAPSPRSAALEQLLLALVAIVGLFGLYAETGVGPWIRGTFGGWAPMAVVLMQGVPALVVVWSVLRAYGESWRDVGLAPVRPGRALALGVLAAITGAAVQPLVVAAYLAATGADPSMLLEEKASRMEIFAPIPLAAVVPLALFVAVYEEILFRGFLQSRLLKLFSSEMVPRGVTAALAVGLSSLLFAAGHAYQGPLGPLQALTLAVVLGAYTAITRSLWPAIAAHLLIDVVGLMAARHLLGDVPGSMLLGGPWPWFP